MTCRILVLQPGIEPMPSTVEALSLNCWTAREVPRVMVFNWRDFSVPSVHLEMSGDIFGHRKQGGR